MLLIQDKIYKFLLKTDEERDKWIDAINNEIKKLRGEVEKKVENYYNVKLKKKIIIDYFVNAYVFQKRGSYKINN